MSGPETCNHKSLPKGLYLYGLHPELLNLNRKTNALAEVLVEVYLSFIENPGEGYEPGTAADNKNFHLYFSALWSSLPLVSNQIGNLFAQHEQVEAADAMVRISLII